MLYPCGEATGYDDPDPTPEERAEFDARVEKALKERAAKCDSTCKWCHQRFWSDDGYSVDGFCGHGCKGRSERALAGEGAKRG